MVFAVLGSFSLPTNGNRQVERRFEAHRGNLQVLSRTPLRPLLMSAEHAGSAASGAPLYLGPARPRQPLVRSAFARNMLPRQVEEQSKDPVDRGRVRERLRDIRFQKNHVRACPIGFVMFPSNALREVVFGPHIVHALRAYLLTHMREASYARSGHLAVTTPSWWMPPPWIPMNGTNRTRSPSFVLLKLGSALLGTPQQLNRPSGKALRSWRSDSKYPRSGALAGSFETTSSDARTRVTVQFRSTCRGALHA